MRTIMMTWWWFSHLVSLMRKGAASMHTLPSTDFCLVNGGPILLSSLHFFCIFTLFAESLCKLDTINKLFSVQGPFWSTVDPSSCHVFTSGQNIRFYLSCICWFSLQIGADTTINKLFLFEVRATERFLHWNPQCDMCTKSLMENRHNLPLCISASASEASNSKNI